MKKPKINTMEELSTAIGVSRPTLSRYFQSPGSVRGSTSEKIRLGLERVEYVPNFFATRMNRKTTGVIGVVIPHLNDLFFTSLLEVIENSAMEAGFTVITQSSHGDPEIEALAMEKLLSMSADGVLVAPVGASSNLAALDRLRENLPMVFVDSHLPESFPGVDFVGTDNTQSIGLMVEYLCRTGEPPAYLHMPRLNSNSREREAAYIAHMAQFGFEPVIIKGREADENWKFEAYGYGVMDDHFSRGRFSNATILCANDRLAIGALRAANRHGLFPRGGESRGAIRIAGHDDYPLSRYMTPSLTTVAQDIGSIGREAVRVLAAHVKSGATPPRAPKTWTFDAVLKVRESA